MITASSAFSLALFLTGAPKAAKPVLITFNSAAYSANVEGTVEKRNTFVFYATKGDTLIVNIIPITKGLMTSGTLTYPSGEGTGSHGGLIDAEVLKAGGKFTIEVGLNLMAETVQHGKFRLEIIRYPAYLTQEAGH